jgi:hypothetical protein
LALNSLILCTSLVVISVSPVAPGNLVSIKAIQDLREKAVNSFADAEELIREEEERLQAELSKTNG